MKKIVITGGPCSGKSSLITELENLGYVIFKEVAESLIKRNLKLNNNNILPWENKLEFQKEVFKTQLNIESNLSLENQFVFFDRGIYDNISYLKFNNLYNKEIFNFNNIIYDYVFIPELLPFLENNQVRRESESERLNIHNIILEEYKLRCNNVHIIPLMNVGDRVKYILDIIK